MEDVIALIGINVHNYHLIVGMAKTHRGEEFCVEVTMNNADKDCIQAYLGLEALTFINLYHDNFNGR